MEDERRPWRLERLLFQRRAMTRVEWQLGLVLVGLLALGAWLIFWPLIPTILNNLVVGLIDLVSGFEAPPPPTPGPLPTPSPSPLPSPSPSPAIGS